MRTATALTALSAAASALTVVVSFCPEYGRVPALAGADLGSCLIVFNCFVLLPLVMLAAHCEGRSSPGATGRKFASTPLSGSRPQGPMLMQSGRAAHSHLFAHGDIEDGHSVMTTVGAKAESRREFNSAALGALGLVGASAGAQAKSGDGAKFSFFGLSKGQAAMYSEGAAYGTDQSQGNYSAYSPYSAKSEKSLYNKVDDKPFYKKIVAESKIRLPLYQAYIDKKQWSEITTQSTRFLYSLRKAMNGLAAGTPAAESAKVAFYKDLEKLQFACRQKDQAKAQKYYDSAKANFAAFEKAIN